MNRADVQGLLFSGYAAQPASALLLLRFAAGRPNAWLRRVLWQVSSGATSERHDPFRLNLAFTYNGLTKLGLPEATLTGFSREFRQGMAHPERAAALGDRPPCHAESWDFADSGERGVDGAVLVYASGPAELQEKLAELEQGLRHCELEFECLLTYLPSDRREHFGLEMGASQPSVRGFGRRGSAGPRVARGEFLLGYADGVGDRQRGPVAPARRTTREPPAMAKGGKVDLGLNGSYLVVRKLEQRVEAFQAFIDAAGESARHELCAAHVRRANPRDGLTGDERDSNRHRLLRRGRMYGASAESEAGERGLLFLALNADLARQFEHVQGQWLARGLLPGVLGAPDPLLGQETLDDAGEPSAPTFTLPGEPVRRRLSGLSPFVRVRGGLYGFLPSVRALGYLADLDGSRASS